MSLFLDNGYLNFEHVYKYKSAFTFITGARGIGKTYGALEYLCNNHIPFLYLRRRGKQADFINNHELSPFSAVEKNTQLEIHTDTIDQGVYAIYMSRKPDGTEWDDSTPFGMVTALTTFANVRGINADWIDFILYDEFIPEKHEQHITGEAEALWNLYETLNRNRELEGRPPIKMVCLSNANTYFNPYFASINCLNDVGTMIEKGDFIKTIPEKELTLVLLQNSPISEKKKKTALYKLTQESVSFQAMALQNSFNIDTKDVRPLDKSQFIPFIKCGELYINVIRNPDTLGCDYYVSTKSMGTAKEEYNTIKEVKRAMGKSLHVLRACGGIDTIYEDIKAKAIADYYYTEIKNRVV